MYLPIYCSIVEAESSFFVALSLAQLDREPTEGPCKKLAASWGVSSCFLFDLEFWSEKKIYGSWRTMKKKVV